MDVKELPVVRALLSETLSLMTAPPVNLGVICRFLDVAVYEQPCSSFGAILVRRDGRRVILVNASLPQGRARFSIAHELGHFLLRHPPVSHVSDFCARSLERQADRFAAELLMPRELIASDRLRLDGAALKRLYRVSQQALDIRLEGLKRFSA